VASGSEPAYIIGVVEEVEAVADEDDAGAVVREVTQHDDEALLKSEVLAFGRLIQKEDTGLVE